ncbi:hypothetical protein [Bacillus mobilis]|uniref:hypothetical protein n=1 Tax=Bacillus mobilis TaxID=2026190 RepID=UPI0036751640
MDILNILGVFGIGTASIVAGIVYLSKQVFLHKLKKLEENHRSELRKREEDHKKELNKELKKIESDFKILIERQLEEHKSELKKINDKYHITFSKLHAERAETIKRLHTKLVELEISTWDLLSWDGVNLPNSINKKIDKQHLKESVDEMAEKAVDLYDDFKRNEIYFPENISSVFGEITANMNEITSNIYLYINMDNNSVPDLESFLEKEKETVEQINERIPDAKQSLQIEFRKLLGVVEE